MLKILRSWIAVSFFPLSTLLANTSSSCFDLDYTPYSGAENILALQNSLERLEDSLFSNPSGKLSPILNEDPRLTFFKESRWGKSLRHFLFWTPVNLSAIITQHEIFGHGYRARDLGSEYVSVTGYKMKVVRGSTSLDTTPKLTTSQLLAINIAGIEADTILANRTRIKWLTNQQIDPRQYLLYFISSLSLTQYTFVNESPLQNPATTGNDISSFLFYLKKTYPDTSLTKKDLKRFSFVNLLDPFLYLSVYSVNYYLEFSSSMKIPMIEFGPMKYLPAAKICLTPFGIQGFFEHFFQVNEGSPTYVYMKWGKNGVNTYSGMGIKNESLFKRVWGSLGLRADLWHQPDVLFEQGLLSAEEVMDLPMGAEIPQLYPDEVLQRKRFGGAFSVIGMVGKESWPAQILLELGYKSDGFLPGEALRAAPIVRGGFSASF